MTIKTCRRLEVNQFNVEIIYQDMETPLIGGIAFNGQEISIAEWLAIRDWIKQHYEKHLDHSGGPVTHNRQNT